MAPLALKRLMAELKAVRASMAAGEVPWLLRCEPIDDNLLGWRVDMRFPEDSLLQRSLDRFAAGLLDDARNMLHFQLRFPPEYPMRPPEIWLHKPRLKYESGTPVTFGGRVCIPRLTSSEWTPVTGIGAVLKEVQTQLVYAGAEVDATVAIRPYLEPPLMINRIQSGLIPDANDFVQENLQVGRGGVGRWRAGARPLLSGGGGLGVTPCPGEGISVGSSPTCHMPQPHMRSAQ